MKKIEKSCNKETHKSMLYLQREIIKTLIVKEINIARSEGEKTSRLTSLYNKVSEIIC